jgi:pilus assembly protein FimV
MAQRVLECFVKLQDSQDPSTFMMRPSCLTASLSAMLVCTATPQALALSLAGGGGAATMGQALDITVPVRLEPGESLSSECVSADVSYGEQRLPASGVRSTVEMLGPESARIRVRTLMAVDEPVVTLDVGAGCGTRVSRRYVLPAAPPTTANGPVGPLVRPIILPTAPANLPAAERAVAAATTSQPVAEAASKAAARGTRAQTKAPAEPRVTARAVPVGPQRLAADVTSKLRMDMVEPLPATDTDALSIERAIEAVVEATKTVRVVAEQAAAARQRAAALEVTVEQLQAQAKVSRETTEQLQRRLSVSEAAARLSWWLLALCVALGLTCLWLMRRAKSAARLAASAAADGLTGQSHQGPASQQGPTSQSSTSPAALVAGVVPDRGGPASAAATLAAMVTPSAAAQSAAQSAEQSAVPSMFPTTLSHVGPAPTVGDAKRRGAAAFLPADTWLPTLDNEVSPASLQGLTTLAALPPESAVERTDPTLQSVPGQRTVLRDVSIEELIDLEQQADFFIALGQDDAAVSLLNEHLRVTGGASPLPYLKLLEIHRRRDERSDYERIRGRFNQRFNAYAPDWDVGLQSGRSLEDYPGVVPRLQQVWGKPVDSMAELEALLFRKSRGELFDLPAYRDVLFLYGLARDLMDREGAGAGDVDLLLPIATLGQASASNRAGFVVPSGYNETAPMPLDSPPVGVDAPRSGQVADHGSRSQERLTVPLDFDLTLEQGRHASLFDPLQGPPQGPRG